MNERCLENEKRKENVPERPDKWLKSIQKQSQYSNSKWIKLGKFQDVNSINLKTNSSNSTILQAL